MAKTKRKQLAALAALQVTSPESSKKPIEEHQNGHFPTFNEFYDKSSAPFEVRQQRIIIWIPSSDSAPRLVNSRGFRISSTPSRKRKRSIVNEEKTSSDGEDGQVYKKYAKIILKLDSWNSKKNIDALPPLDPPLVEAPPLNAQKSYQRRKPDSSISCKERVLSALIVGKNLPGSSSVLASKKTKAVDKDQHLPRSLPGDDGERSKDLAPGETMAREPGSAQFSRRLGLRTRKTASHMDLVSVNPGRQELRPEQEGIITTRKVVINPSRKFVISPEKLGKSQEKANSTPTRQKTKLLNDTLTRHEQTAARLELTSHSEDQLKLRSAVKMRSDPESSGVGVGATARLSKGVTELKGTSKSAIRNAAVLGTPKTTTKPRNGDLQLVIHSDNPSYRKGKVLVDRPSSKLNNTSRVSIVKPIQSKSPSTSEKQDGVAPLHTSVLRIRKKGLTQPGRSTSTASEINSVRNLAALDDFNDVALALGRLHAIEPVRNSESSAGVPSIDEPNELHRGPDVVTSSNNAALNSRSRRISFLGRQAGTSEEELKRVNLGLNAQRGISSHLNSLTTSGRTGANGASRLRAKFAGAAASLHLKNGQNGHVGLIRQGNQPKLQSRVYGSYFRNHVDVAAMIRSKLEEVGGLTEWLIGGGLGVFVDLFQERKIEERDLLNLTMGSLKDFGVHAVGPRRKLIWMIEHLL